MTRSVGRGRRRIAVLAALCLLWSLAALTPAAAACTPVNRVLANGNPFQQSGALRLTVDGLGAFGSAVTSDPVLFRPVDADVSPTGTVFESRLYASPAGEMLQDDCQGQTVSVIDQGSDVLHTATSLGNLQVELIQRVRPLVEGGNGSTLVQTYRFENVGQSSVPLTLVRHMDTDLLFDGSAVDGAAARSAGMTEVPLGSTLFGFDSSEAPQDPTTFVAINGSLGSDTTPSAFTIQPFRFSDNIVNAGGIPDALAGAVHNDTQPDPPDGIVDTNFDATLSQEWGRTLAPGAVVRFVTRTRFGSSTPNLPPNAPDLPLSEAPDIIVANGKATVDVLAHASDPDDEVDELTLASFTQGTRGSVACERALCTYTQTDFDFGGTDTFDYTIEDASGGRDTGTVTVTFPIPDEVAGFARDDFMESGEGTVAIEVTANDDLNPPENDFSPVSISTFDEQSNNGGDVVCAPQGPCTYTSPIGFVGNDVFHYTLTGQEGVQDTARVVVAVSRCPVLSGAISGQPGLVVGQRWETCSSPIAHNTSTKITPMLQNPHGAFALMTSGDRGLLTQTNTTGSAGRDHGTAVRGARDVSVLRLDLNIPEDHDCLSFRTVFASEEYPEFVGSAFNDAFIAELGESTWSVTGSTISAPDNIAFDANGNVISINSVLFDSNLTSTGTQYDGATRLIQVQGATDPGPQSLFLSIFDVGDGSWDSAAFIDRLATGTVEGGCDDGAVLLDTVPPAAVSNFVGAGGHLIPAQGGGLLGKTTLSWTNPTSADLTRLVIRRTPGTQGATDELDGTGVYDAVKPDIGTKATRTLPVGQTFTFTAFAFDEASNRSASRSVTAYGTELVRTLPNENPAIVTDPNSAIMRWVLRRGDNNNPLANRTVQLWGKHATADTYGEAPRATALTNANGVVTFTRPLRRSWDYRVRFPGAGAFTGSESTSVSVLFRPLVTGTVADATVDLGQVSTFSGGVSPYYVGRKVFLQELIEGEWQTIASRTLGEPEGSPLRSRYTFSQRPATVGLHPYRVVLPADPGVHVVGRSPRRDVTVR